MPKVYITGVGFITSIGNDAASVSESLRELRHGMELYPPFQKPEVPVKVAAPIRDFQTDSIDQEDWVFPARYRIKRELLRGMAPHGVYAYCAMQQAIEDAKLTEAEVSNPDTGLYAASAGSPFLLGYHLERMRKMGVMRCPPLGIVASISGTVNFNLVSHFKIRGASTGFSSACASSAHALAFAHDEIALGRQKRMFVIGAEDGNVESILPFAGMRALSLQNDPSIASRPFDSARDGFVGTGGATVLVMESEDEVARRGAKVYGEMAGWGQASDGYNVAISHPDGDGLRTAIENALRLSEVAPEEVDYVNAHATSTPIGDISEAKALRTIFKGNPSRPAISSTKALTGHGLSLAGAMEAGFCALAMKEGFIPGSAHISNLDPACAGLNIIRATLPQRPNVVISNSSGFGGANVCLVFKAG
ncbi:beta-ketoacyl-[acyl-carrier-protein] synthase family protein [Oleiharenicola lentus]|uniref:3-oxoacyl-[acyl-carrier-protein] synthase 1 n=1 Tax=Oleiharenicola lentus TaxID=2508720 RepID=A0A4Q1C488_9BACT|nr:beta-ketoacyl-[acyl-carrier-protein] synthase family protein [Oleiharenicola lentus]RXK53224.1 beta-ketoacyl-[acyl-carrier-protein] synthase family protein [Oleiharenicola lentus]